MANAYATFAASGTKVEPYSVTEVKRGGEVEQGFDPPKQERRWTATRQQRDQRAAERHSERHGEDAKRLGKPAAGKTGTTDENKSAWFIGYTPKLSTSVTMFREDPKNPASSR